MQRPGLFPAAAWLARLSPDMIRADAFAGFTNAAIVLPQGVAFATIAGLPPEYGLFTAMVTAVVAAVFGSSMIMISGPTTAISAVLFATLSGVAEPGTAQYIQMALTLTILVGVVQVIAGLARMGALVSFVSHSVITAFTAAAACLIAVSQLAGVLGIEVERGGNVLERILRIGEHIQEVNLHALAIAVFTLVTAVVMARVNKRLPGLLIAMVAGSVLAVLLDAGGHGVAFVGQLPPMTPSFHAPQTTVSQVVELAPSAMAIALIGLLEAISIGRAFAVRRKEAFSPNQEMFGQGLSNVVGGFFQCYAGSGSFTRSGVNATAGAVTPLSGIFASLFLAVSLIFITPLIAMIPLPALAGVILLVAWNLVDFKELRHVIGLRSPETLILGLTLAVGLMVELDFAIYIGVIASLCVFIYDSSRPELLVQAPLVTGSGQRKFMDVALNGQDQCPQLTTLSLEGPLFFGSVEHISRKLKEIPQVQRDGANIVLVFRGVGRVDLAGADLLIETIRDVRARNGAIKIVAAYPPFVKGLRQFDVVAVLGEDNLHTSKNEAVKSLMTRFDIRRCKACLFDVFQECDDLREKEV